MAFFVPISALGENFNPRNIQYMPVVKIFIRLDLDKKVTFSVGRQIYGLILNTLSFEDRRYRIIESRRLFNPNYPNVRSQL